MARIVTILKMLFYIYHIWSITLHSIAEYKIATCLHGFSTFWMERKLSFLSAYHLFIWLGRQIFDSCEFTYSLSLSTISCTMLKTLIAMMTSLTINLVRRLWLLCYLHCLLSNERFPSVILRKWFNTLFI